MRYLAVIFGLLLLAAVTSDAFEVMLLPRRLRRTLRPVRIFFRSSWCAWTSIARHLKRGRRRDAFLSLFGPLSMVLLLLLWASGLIISFAFLHWAAQGVRSVSLLSDFYLSGATFFTVGYGDVVPKTSLSRMLAIVESGAGLAFITVTISYLPVLYQLFSRRESRVIQLDARAGSPPAASALLCRHNDFEAMPELSDLLKEWEQWCAELVESHLSYPMLSYYRSQHDNQSWLAALTAILDTCALLLTGFSGVRTFQARVTFATGRLAAVELCRVFHLKALASATDRLPPDDFVQLERQLSESGLTFSEADSAEERLRTLRSTYEPFMLALSRHFLLGLPPWMRGEEEVDNWQRSRGGAAAREIFDTAPALPE
ncbi:MAG: two pore domain potassium channel family protein [Acidobacteriaceae bacterium]|nr:two pore domain potassium channel family protein [Acidobacteriaceae bacterium]MBV9675117.1 two pore domain potassium channel family protein [Acidobacteriaceae bacterium]